MIDIAFDAARGRVTIRDLPYLLIQPATLVGFQKAAEAAGAAAGEWLEAGGRAGGRRSSSKLRETRPTVSIGAFAQAYLDMGADIGWGTFRVTRASVSDLEVEVRNSPFAEAYGPSPVPVCRFTAGVIAGLGDVLFGSATCSELACAATGAPACRFVCRKT